MFGQVLGRDRGFLVATEFFFFFMCRDRGPLCHNMALRLDAASRLRHSFSMSRQCFTSLSR